MKYKKGDVVVCVDKGVAHESRPETDPRRHGEGWKLGYMFKVYSITHPDAGDILWPAQGFGVWADAVEPEPVKKMYDKLRKQVEKEIS